MNRDYPIRLQPGFDFREPEQFWDTRWEELWATARLKLAQLPYQLIEHRLPEHTNDIT